MSRAGPNGRIGSARFSEVRQPGLSGMQVDQKGVVPRGFCGGCGQLVAVAQGHRPASSPSCATCGG